MNNFYFQKLWVLGTRMQLRVWDRMGDTVAWEEIKWKFKSLKLNLHKVNAKRVYLKDSKNILHEILENWA